MKYDAMSAIQWYAIKYAKNNGFDIYNFYGIDGNFKNNNSMHGVYEFKKGFNGKVVELIGEFDLPINKAKYRFYTLAFSTYKKLKNIMVNIYHNIDNAAKEYGFGGNYVMGANIAGFIKVADAMMAHGIV